MSYENAYKLFQILKVLYNKSNEKLTYNEIDIAVALVYPINTSELKMMLENLRNNNYIKMYMETNLLDLDSKTEYKYQITPTGISKYFEISTQMESRAYHQSEYEEEEETRKKSNRRWLIGCAIAFVVLITIMIVVILSSG